MELLRLMKRIFLVHIRESMTMNKNLENEVESKDAAYLEIL